MFQPTLPLRGATWYFNSAINASGVSTHAPLAGSDAVAFDRYILGLWFQPTLPLRGATIEEMGMYRWDEFQPTLPLRGATSTTSSASLRWSSFNPRSPCGERRRLVHGRSFRQWVSTHAPLAGSDLVASLRQALPTGFNPRSPCGERLLHLVNVALRAYHMHDVFHPNASSDELRPSETNQKAVRTSQGIPDSPQFAPPIIPTAYS